MLRARIGHRRPASALRCCLAAVAAAIQNDLLMPNAPVNDHRKFNRLRLVVSHVVKQ